MLNIIITFIFFSLISYSAYIQLFNHSIYADQANTNTIKQRKIPASRGDIIDRNGIVLATTKYQNDLYVIPYYFHDDVNLICGNIKIDCNALTTKLTKNIFNRALIARDISDDLAMGYEKIPGLSIHRFGKRIYNTEGATSHIIGYVGKINKSILEEDNDDSLYANDDFAGQSGLEYVYDRELHGLNGADQYVVMANGLELLSPNRFLPKDKIVIKPVKGNNLVLSIDDRIQLVLAKEIGWRKGAAVMLDIHSGNVLGMYSSPGYDPGHIRNSFNDVNYPLLNRAIRSYAPGSTFKLVVALAALELGIIKPTDTFNCPGYFDFGGRRWQCWKHGKLGTHGKISLRNAIKESCDVYFYNLSLKVGLNNIIRYAHMLGLNEYTGIDLDGESKGSITGKIKYKGAVLNTGIGQGEVLVSPLQLARAYATILNYGQLYVPHLVSYSNPTIIKSNSFKKENIELLMDAMYAVVNEVGGTGFWSRIPGVIAAGKSGSAQVIGLGKKGKKDTGIFISYWPVINPQIVVSIVVEEGEHGSLVAPIAFRAIQEYMKEHNASINN
jgi:penicillin-binding protein 2